MQHLLEEGERGKGENSCYGFRVASFKLIPNAFINSINLMNPINVTNPILKATSNNSKFVTPAQAGVQ